MKNKIVDTFIELVKIDSTTGNEYKIANYIREKLEEIGIVSKIDINGNLIFEVEGDNNKERIFLNAHMDTVEPGKNIKVVIENGIIKSDGKTILGADNKAALAAILETIKEINERKIKTNHPLDIVFTVCEESENLGAINLDYSKIKAKKRLCV